MAPALEANCISVRGLTVFRQDVLAVDGVSFDVAKGAWFGLIGANGSGKSSLLRALAGRLPCTVDSLSIDGVDLSRSPNERARQLGFMPPTEYLPNALTGRDLFNLIEPDDTQWHGALRLIWDAIELDRLLDLPIGSCSAGMVVSPGVV